MVLLFSSTEIFLLDSINSPSITLSLVRSTFCSKKLGCLELFFWLSGNLRG